MSYLLYLNWRPLFSFLKISQIHHVGQVTEIHQCFNALRNRPETFSEQQVSTWLGSWLGLQARYSMDAWRFTPNPNLANFSLSETHLMEGLESSPRMGRLYQNRTLKLALLTDGLLFSEGFFTLLLSVLQGLLGFSLFVCFVLAGWLVGFLIQLLYPWCSNMYPE